MERFFFQFYPLTFAQMQLLKFKSSCADVDDVKFVINYDFPGAVEDYIHRSVSGYPMIHLAFSHADPIKI